MTHTALLKFAPETSLQRVNDPAWHGRGRTMYDHLKFLPGASSVPVLIDHDWGRQIGTVEKLTRVDWIDGWWFCGLATITDLPSWLRRGGRVSFAHQPIGTSDFNDCEIRRKGYVTEISVLSPGVDPAEPCAEVLTLRRTETPRPPARTHDSRGRFNQPAETVTGGRLIRREAIGQVTGLR